MKIKRFNNNLVRANMYLIENDEHSLIIDPSTIDYLSINGVVDYIILTHEHYDHISAVNYWKDKTNAKVIASANCQKGLQNPARNFSRFYKEFCELQTMIKIEDDIENCEYSCSADITFNGEYLLNWQSNSLRLFECPGHSKGSICVLLNNKILFCGDTLFKDYPIATGFPGGSKKQWVEYSKPMLKSLPKDIIVYPGHFQPFKLKDYKFWEVI
ncbi:MAG: MBL fold metallo-hydrolase [Phascolarctobacterium sp.]|nr:MBL fold metallo-hydrolase [Phascolarctobacterium sp.]